MARKMCLDYILGIPALMSGTDFGRINAVIGLCGSAINLLILYH